MGDEVRRQELGQFLRACRARLSPAEVGLPDLGRRRTAGLRREEVAQLAGIGLVWYTWLEQGRDIRVSPPLLASVARALRLSADQTDYLFALAGHAAAPAATEPGAERTLQRVIDQFGSAPAYVHNPRLDMVAANRAMYLAVPYLRDIPMAEHNILRVMFTNAACRALIVDWEAHAQRGLAQFRATWALHAEDPSFNALVEELMRSSPEFRAWWPRQDVGRRPIDRLELDHPEVGRLALERTELMLSAHSDLSLVLNMPAEESDTGAKLRQLTGSAP
jgi:transcriptional regulator with XRE-family HTH domain